MKVRLPLSVTIILAILAIVIGVPTSILPFSRGTRLRDRGRRLRARDARTLLQRPGERTVLLLRSFEDEELVDPRPSMFLSQQRLEVRLSSALRQLGPVITVGRPSDPMGFAGAARFYVSNSNWQRAVEYLMVHSVRRRRHRGTDRGPVVGDRNGDQVRITQKPSVFLTSRKPKAEKLVADRRLDRIRQTFEYGPVEQADGKRTPSAVQVLPGAKRKIPRRSFSC